MTALVGAPPPLPRSIVNAVACKSERRRGGIAKAFLARGARGYFGYSEGVNSGFADDQGLNPFRGPCIPGKSNVDCQVLATATKPNTPRQAEFGMAADPNAPITPCASLPSTPDLAMTCAECGMEIGGGVKSQMCASGWYGSALDAACQQKLCAASAADIPGGRPAAGASREPLKAPTTDVTARRAGVDLAAPLAAGAGPTA